MKMFVCYSQNHINLIVYDSNLVVLQLLFNAYAVFVSIFSTQYMD